ncbi:hypothetical protein HBE96_15100 [Clostridium sp. P21]|uniref:Uncharacterized protein n=1 Tax=Clostridium muellerianum TaxID=2716538 RepID=A0A7Y0HQN0_9CLOT|nr:hypothetical protein [Clostridium muellerianum]NMM63978.1 hypothetical protein [Clostridium muellerianum]
MKKSTRVKKYKKARRIRLLISTFFVLLVVITSFLGFKFYCSKKSINSLKVSADSSPKIKREKSKTADAIPESVLNSNNETTDSENKDLRKFPYPFSSMLSICSDIDDTTLDEFQTYHKFLNTKEKTPYGEGLGLDIGDSLWMYMADNTTSTVDTHGNGVENIMTFFTGTSKTEKHNANEIIHFVDSGWIDCIHAFGDFSTKNEKGTLFNRSLAKNAWNALNSINFKPTVWINHGNKSNKQNFGAHGTSSFMNYQQGDNPNSSYYHTDLTMQDGVKYIWNSLSDTSFGHAYPLYELSLRDGQKVWGFYRYTNNLVNGKMDWTWTPEHIHRQLTKGNLDSIVSNKQYSIVAQHFGVNTEYLFKPENIQSLRLLKEYETNGKILVAKTSRLLNYANIHKYLMYNKVTEDGKTYINISSVDDPIFGKSTPTIDNIRGITFYCDDPENTVFLLNKTKISSDNLQVNPKDETGKASISIKWFKSDYTDYTK